MARVEALEEGFELAPALGQGSPFEREHGYYLDPISPAVATLPSGWEERLTRIQLEPATAVLINLPFGRGRVFQRVGDRPLPEWAKEFDAPSWAQFFLKYVVSHPAVTCAIPGMTKPHHAVDNLGACRGVLPNAATRKRMEAFVDGL